MVIRVLAAILLSSAALFASPANAQCTGQPPGNQVCASPDNAAGLPKFRSLVARDIPSLAPGTNGQIVYNNGGVFGGFTVAGDCTFSVPNFTCTKTNGLNFAPVATSGVYNDLTGKPVLVASATTDTTNASNITSGSLANARLTNGFVNTGVGLAGGALIGGGTIAADIATPAQFEAGTANKVLVADKVFVAEVPITFSATPTLDFSTFFNASITLTGNITSVNLTNIKASQSGLIRFIQDATGGRTIPVTFNSTFKCAGACSYVLSTAANAVDILPYSCISSSYCIGGTLLKDVK